MEENKDNQTDAFLKKYLREIPIDQPSKSFTTHVMDVVYQESTSKVTKYVPLIPKKVWLGVLAIVIAILLIPLKDQKGGILDKVSLDFSFLDKLNFSGLLEGFSISTITFYGLLLFSIMIFVQVFYLKGYFEKRIL